MPLERSAPLSARLLAVPTGRGHTSPTSATPGVCWRAPVKPSQKLKARDDHDAAVLQLRRQEVFLRATSDALAPALAQRSALRLPLTQAQRALEQVPRVIGLKRVQEQLKSSLAALAHLDVLALAQREADETQRLFDHVNMAATDPRFLEFEAWLAHLLEQKVGQHRGGGPLTHAQAKGIYNELCELPAARVALDDALVEKVRLGQDQLKLKSPQTAGKKSFDLRGCTRQGAVISNVEVTTVERAATRPRDFGRAIVHGMDKAKGDPTILPWQLREITIFADWFCGRRRASNQCELDYHGDGTYTVFSPQGERLYRRHILKDDFPHYLRRHPEVAQWLDRINIITQQADACAHFVRRRAAWSFLEHDAKLARAWHKNRGRLAREREYVRSPRRPVLGQGGLHQRQPEA